MALYDPHDFADLEFAMAWCPSCNREVLTHASYSADGAEQRACVHCDRPLPIEVRVAHGGNLPEFGYGLLESQGCGNPDCGGGQCSRQMMQEAEESPD
jgi:hypothetical protein